MVPCQGFWGNPKVLDNVRVEKAFIDFQWLGGSNAQLVFVHDDTKRILKHEVKCGS